MSDAPETPEAPKRKLTQAEMRAARLQKALRENLRRRKAAGIPVDEHAAYNEKAKPDEDENAAKT